MDVYDENFFGRLISMFVALVLFFYVMLMISGQEFTFFMIGVSFFCAILLGFAAGKAELSGIKSFGLGFLFGLVCALGSLLFGAYGSSLSFALFFNFLYFAVIAGFFTLVFAGLSFIMMKYSVFE